jgi:hypothetical protein
MPISKAWRSLAEQDASNAEWQSDLVGSYQKVGDVMVAQGKLQDGLNAHRQSLMISKPGRAT